MATVSGLKLPSIWTCLSVGFLSYMTYNLYQLYGLYAPASCTGKDGNCLKSYLSKTNVKLQLRLYTSSSSVVRTYASLKELWMFDNLDPFETITHNLTVKIPLATRKNGSMYMHAFILPAGSHALAEGKWKVLASAPLTKLAVPEAATFQLIGDASPSEPAQPVKDKPVMHWRSQLTLSIMTDAFAFDRRNMLPDLHHLILTERNGIEYLPILFIDEMSCRVKDLQPLNESAKLMPLTVEYTPISIGKLRLWNTMSASLSQLTELGFSDRDLDDVKGLFVDTNIYLLLLTMMVSVCHLLFDFLAFKNDISFWRNRDNMVGLSTKAVIWRCFSTSVVFLYLCDQKTSYLVLIPMGVAAVIEYWKMFKALKIEVTLTGVHFGTSSASEQETEKLDDKAMRWLYIVLIPLCIAGSIYSLFYTPHKSWFSWVIQSLVNGVYAFGFIFMLPQLYINYKLKSVAHLPWRAFMYKAFNTFIDDVFAFIITMPTSHRLACFRDDIVFLIYLYQRWLYPVDKTRTNEFGQTFEEQDKTSKKKQ